MLELNAIFKKKTRLVAGIVAVALVILFAWLAFGPDLREAARVGNAVIHEQDVKDRLAVFRTAKGLDDAEAWELWLSTERKDAQECKDDLLNELIDRELVNQAASSLGVQVGEAEIQAEVERNKTSFAANLFGVGEDEVPRVLEENPGIQGSDSEGGQDVPSAQEMLDEAWGHALAQSGFDEATFRSAARESAQERLMTEKLEAEGKSFDPWFEEFKSTCPVTVTHWPI